MLRDPEIQNPCSRQAKKFTRRFRVTFRLFNYIVDLCRQVNLFNTKAHKRSIPLEIKILIGLRILARGNCGDDIEEIKELKNQQYTKYFIHLLRTLVNFSMINLFSLMVMNRLKLQLYIVKLVSTTVSNFFI